LFAAFEMSKRRVRCAHTEGLGCFRPVTVNRTLGPRAHRKLAGKFGVRVKTGLSDGDRSIYLVTSFYSDPELAGLEPPEERTIEYDEEALRHFEEDP